VVFSALPPELRLPTSFDVSITAARGALSFRAVTPTIAKTN
jgi:hypothetical protein